MKTIKRYLKERLLSWLAPKLNTVIKPIKHDKISIYTFEVYWARFYYLNPKRNKVNKSSTRIIFNNYPHKIHLEKIVKGVHPGIKINAYNYLKQQLNKF